MAKYAHRANQFPQFRYDRNAGIFGWNWAFTPCLVILKDTFLKYASNSRFRIWPFRCFSDPQNPDPVYAFLSQNQVENSQNFKKKKILKIEKKCSFFTYRPFSQPENSWFQLKSKKSGFGCIWTFQVILYQFLMNFLLKINIQQY